MKLGLIATGVPAASGAYSWVVGRHSNGTTPAGGGYAVRVKSQLVTAKSDYSDVAFTIN